MTFMHRGLRRSLAAGGSAVLALVLVTGCSTTVDGKGVALRAAGSSASSSRTGFPSAPASDNGGAPATGSLTATTSPAPDARWHSDRAVDEAEEQLRVDIPSWDGPTEAELHALDALGSRRLADPLYF